MMRWISPTALAAVLTLAAAAPPACAAPADRLDVPVTYYTLPNGLKVVLSRNPTSPIVTVSVYYGIGFRVEPRDRTGFAHLFEHLMFQGSAHAPKGTLIGTVTNSGGDLNGSTRFDFTNYYEAMPSNATARCGFPVWLSPFPRNSSGLHRTYSWAALWELLRPTSRRTD
jgi:hypothetical protein